MANLEQPADHPSRGPAHIIETVNKVVRTSRQMLPEIGRAPTSEELAEKLAIPAETVQKVLEIARQPIRLETQPGHADDPRPC
jgi:RNA polymerase primary sigma factor